MICSKAKLVLWPSKETTAGNAIGLRVSGESPSSFPNPCTMVELTMALFARFHVNGVIEDIMTFFS